MTDLFEYYMKEIETSFQGWDFSHIHNRLFEYPTPWNYRATILPYVVNATNLLDMGTGGGEFLSQLPLPENTCATEAYEPNIPIARQRLGPLGVKLIALTDPAILPFNDDFFDLIINRHEEYNIDEIFRILKPGSYFITQQVGSDDCLEINQWLNAPPPEYSDLIWNLDTAVSELIEKGFSIHIKREDFPISRIFDIGALIYYLKAIPWQVPDFSIDKYKKQLQALHEKIQTNEYIDATSHRFIIIAQLPKS